MAVITDILIIILLISAIALIVYLVFFLRNLSKSIANIEDEVHQLSQKSIPILEDLNEMLDKINEIADKTESKIDDVNYAFDSIKSFVTKFIPHKSTNQKESNEKNPVIDLITNINAIKKGVSAFWNSYKTKN